ncbi:methionine--tRNA ligase [Patescibacteria group bacterium]|nr:methionine--tRNA ligase [Patescibacteria group bacterium]
MEPVTYEEFAKIEFLVGEIIESVNVEWSEKLIRMRVDFGPLGVKTVISGIRAWYSAEALLGKKTVFVVNIIPKRIKDELSEAMLFGAQDETIMSLLLLDHEVKNGSKVF